MKNLSKAVAVVFIAALAGGCANTTQLQADVDQLKAQMKEVSAQAAEANTRSKAAEDAANRAAASAEETNSKLDRMFKKSMMK